jgi:hypothetical protein
MHRTQLSHGPAPLQDASRARAGSTRRPGGSGILSPGRTPETEAAALEQRTGLLLIALALAAFGVQRALHAIAMLPAPASALLLVCLALQAALALLAAFGVWRERPWAPAVLLLLGAVIAATALIEAIVLGILGWLYALVIAVLAIAIALLLGAWLRRRPLSL